MARIAKSDVNRALETAAKTLVRLGGDDGRISRKEVKDALATDRVPRRQAGLVDIFFRFIDHRDHVAGAQITKKDIDSAVEYAREKLIDKYDVNNNGLSQSEIAEMSTTGQLAVQLAKELRMAATIALVADPVDPPIVAMYGIMVEPDPPIMMRYGIQIPVDPGIVAEYGVMVPDPEPVALYGIMVDPDPPVVMRYGFLPPVDPNPDPPVVMRYGFLPPTQRQDPLSDARLFARGEIDDE